jgi:hypothetical protein
MVLILKYRSEFENKTISDGPGSPQVTIEPWNMKDVFRQQKMRPAEFRDF